jgi:hypothetical protein
MSIACSYEESELSMDIDGITTRSDETVVTHCGRVQYDVATDVSAPFVVPLQDDTVRLELTARPTFADAYTTQQFEVSTAPSSPRIHRMSTCNTRTTVSCRRL